MSIYDDYLRKLDESEAAANQQTALSTKDQIDKLEAQKKLISADKQTAYKGAYVDYAKNINPYGVQTESAYASGLGGAGKGETAQANYYNAYQNQLGNASTNAATSLNNINTSVNDAYAQQQAAQLSAAQAKSENAGNALWTYNDYLNTKAQQEESIRQYNESLALQKAQQEESVRQYNEQMAYQKQQDALSRSSGGSSGSGSSSSGTNVFDKLVALLDANQNYYDSSDPNPTRTLKQKARELLAQNKAYLTPEEYYEIAQAYGL